MKSRWAGFLCRAIGASVSACALLAAPPLPLHAANNAEPLQITSRALPNGMRIVVVEDHAVPVVQTAVWYRFGANDERPGLTGLAHALEHMMFRGTPTLSGAGLDDVVTRLGAQETAVTANDYTVYRFIAPADKLELALRIEADRMEHLLLADPTWADEKEAVLSEDDSDLRQPLTHLYSDVCDAASTTRLCAISPLGSHADVARAGAEDLRSYYQDWYAPNNATLVITGDVRTQDVFALTDSIFGPIAPSNLPKRSSAPVFYNSDKKVQIDGDFPFQLIDLAYPAPGTGDPDNGLMHIVDSVVNDQRSEFFKALIRSGYAVAYSTQLDQNVHGGLYHVFMVTAPGHGPGQLRDAFSDVMESEGDNGFPADLVSGAQAKLAQRAIYARDSISGLGDRIGYALAIQGVPDPAADDARIAAATPKDVAIVARKYFGAPVVIGLLNPVGLNTGETPNPPITDVSDDFSRRAPSGKIVEARWVTNALEAPAQLRTRVNPVAFTLNNGLRVLVQEIHANPTVFVEGSVETSPRFDPPGKEGVGAMVATLLSYGGAKYDFDAQRTVASRLGATLDLGYDFSAHGRAEDLPQLLDVLADALQHPAFNGDDVRLVRKQTLEAVRARDADPDFRGTADFDSLLLRPDDPTLRQANANSVSTINRQDLHAFAERYLRPDLTTITIVGDIDRARVEAVLNDTFGAWHGVGPHPTADPGPIPPAHAAQRYVVSDRHIVEVHLGEPAPTRANPDYFALSVINEILGADGGYDTRLMSELRTRLHLVYDASSALDVDRYRGTLNFYLSADPKHVAEAVTVLRGQLDRLKDDPVGPFEMERAKAKIVARQIVSEQSTQTVATRVHTIGVDRLPLNYDAVLPARYAAIDGAVIERVARAYLHSDALVEVYEGPRP